MKSDKEEEVLDPLMLPDHIFHHLSGNLPSFNTITALENGAGTRKRN